MNDVETDAACPAVIHAPISASLVLVKDSDSLEPSEPDEDELVAPGRELLDPLSEATARRAIGFRVRAALGADRLDLRVNPLPLETGGKSFNWLCFGSQAEVDTWRLSDAFAAPVLASVEEWLQRQCASFGEALARFFDRSELLDAVLRSCLDDRHLLVLLRRLRGETLEVIASQLEVTRERVRQLEVSAQNSIIGKMVSLRSSGHPGYSALYAFARRLARRVLLGPQRSMGRLCPTSGVRRQGGHSTVLISNF
jgi:hypothetical protein